MDAPTRTWRVPNAVEDRRCARSGFASGPLMDLRWRLRPDPAVESLAVTLAPEAAAAPGAAWFGHLRDGIEELYRTARSRGDRVCCGWVEFTHLWVNEQWVRTGEVRGTGFLIVGADLWGDRMQHAEAHQCRLLPPPSPAWWTADVLHLARALQAGAPADGLPVLADALQDAGCDDALLLDHLRTCRDHAPGCWVPDFLLAEDAPRRLPREYDR